MKEPVIDGTSLRVNAITGTQEARFIYRNPLDLPRIGQADIAGNSAEGVYVHAPGQPRIFQRVAPLFHDDPDGAEVFEPFTEVDFTYPPVFTVSLRQVSLAGFRSVLSRQGFLVSDMGHISASGVRDYISNLRGFDELSGLVPVDDEASFRLESRERRRLTWQARWF